MAKSAGAKRLLVLVFSAALLLSGCTALKSFSPGLVRDFKKELGSRYESIETLSFNKVANRDCLYVDCTLSDSAPFYEVYAVYHSIMDLLSDRELLLAFLEKCSFEHGLEPPAETVRFINPGPSIELSLQFGGYRVQRSLSFTRMEHSAEHGGQPLHYYEGVPEWERALHFHEESITDDNEIQPEALLSLIYRHTVRVQEADGSSLLFVPGVPDGAVRVGAEHSESVLRLVTARLGDESAELEVYLDNPQTGESLHAATASISLFYDEQLGYRVFAAEIY